MKKMMMTFKRGSLAVSLLLIGFLCWIIPGSSVRAKVKTISPDTVIGHRGAMDLAPENTMASFRAAKEAGYKMVECDVWYTNSGELFISHDPTIKKMTGKKGYAWKLSTKNRKKFPIIHGSHVKKYPVQYFPKLEEVLKYAENNQLKLLIHLKNRGRVVFPKKGLKKIEKLLKSYKGAKPIFVTSRFRELQYLKKYKWDKCYACLTSSKKPLKQKFKAARKYHCKYYMMIYDRNNKPGKAFLKTIHKAGMKSMFYDIKSRKDAETVFSRGADYCLTNVLLFGGK